MVVESICHGGEKIGGPQDLGVEVGNRECENRGQELVQLGNENYLPNHIEGWS